MQKKETYSQIFWNKFNAVNFAFKLLAEGAKGNMFTGGLLWRPLFHYKVCWRGTLERYFAFDKHFRDNQSWQADVRVSFGNLRVKVKVQYALLSHYSISCMTFLQTKILSGALSDIYIKKIQHLRSKVKFNTSTNMGKDSGL